MEQVEPVRWAAVGEPLLPGDGVYLVDELQRRRILARLADVGSDKQRRVAVEVREIDVRRALAVRKDALAGVAVAEPPRRVSRGDRILAGMTAAGLAMVGMLRIGRGIHSVALRGVLGAGVGIIAFAAVFFFVHNHDDRKPLDDGPDHAMVDDDDATTA